MVERTVIEQAMTERAAKSATGGVLRVVLVATYELGRQPWGLASPAAWLRAQGASVRCLDLSREAMDEAAIAGADLIALHVPMHTATRLVCRLLPVIRGINREAHICVFGLYAPVNEAYLRELGADTILGGEFESGLAGLAARLAERLRDRAVDELRGDPPTSAVGGDNQQSENGISLERQDFLLPDRSGFLPLANYARLRLASGEELLAGYTEASRGCKHLCRHCPIVPVYNGAFRVVQRDVVMEDIRQQIAAGARHITFGDPDFFNGPGHAIPIVEALHVEFPAVTYDATIKIEHLLKHRELLGKLRETGCLFITSAVESIDDAVLEKLDKNHTRADFVKVLEACARAGLALQPTFVAFHPWSTLESYCELLAFLRDHALLESVAPIQVAIRLLIPAGSRLLELDEIAALVGPFDREGLAYPWAHTDARVDELQREVSALVGEGERLNLSRTQIFQRIEKAARTAAGLAPVEVNPLQILSAPVLVPHLTEAWYCCAEPNMEQVNQIGGVKKARCQ